MSRALVQICDLTCRYSPENARPVLALDNISLSIAPGEVVGILGESGSGKSTLAAALMRLLPATAECHGSICFGGRNLLAMDESELRRFRGKSIALIPQDPAASLNPVIRVGTQVSEVLRAHLRLTRSERKNRVQELLREVGFDDPERIGASYPHQLSGGQRQRIAIAQAIASRPALVIADEPTSKLDSLLQAQILSLMSEISRKHGMALLWITHDPATLVGFADRLAVMHEGRIVEQGMTNDVLHQPSHAYTQKLVLTSQEFALDSSHGAGCFEYPTNAQTGAAASAVSLRVQGLSKRYCVRHNLWGKRFEICAASGVSFEIQAGRTLGLVGNSGSGKSTVARCVARLEKPDAGKIWLGNMDIAHLRATDLRPLGVEIQMIFQDPITSMNPRMSAAEIIQEPLLIQTRGTPDDRRTRAAEIMKEVGLSPDWLDRRITEFSGGQRQRIAIARALVLGPKVLIFDEALSGLDLFTRSQITHLLGELQEAHSLTYLLISHDLALVARMANVVAVMSAGRIVEQGPTGEVTSKPVQPETKALVAATACFRTAISKAQGASA